jgi:hypothetical protein
MKKTYLWRILFLIISIVLFGWGYLVVNSFELGICKKGLSCFLKYGSYIDPLMFYSISLIAISPFLFFIADNTFLKWLRFALVWILLSIIFIALAPVSTGGWMSFGPTKESVSIWMGSFLVIISFGLISYQNFSLKKKK